jgi:hypothetical protein
MGCRTYLPRKGNIMDMMKKWLMAGVPGLLFLGGLGSPAVQAQYPHAPPRGTPCPGAYGCLLTAFIHNDACETVRVVISSAAGVHTTILAPNAVAMVPFQGDRPRILTSYSVHTGHLVSNREVVLRHGQHLGVTEREGSPVRLNGDKALSQQATPSEAGDNPTP